MDLKVVDCNIFFNYLHWSSLTIIIKNCPKIKQFGRRFNHNTVITTIIFFNNNPNVFKITKVMQDFRQNVTDKNNFLSDMF